MAYRVLIVDDQKMVRQMFETAVKSSPDYEIAGMAQTADEAVQIKTSSTAAQFHTVPFFVQNRDRTVNIL